MDSKSFVSATLAGAVALFIGGFLIYGLALAGYFAENMNQSIMVDPPNWVWLVLSQVFWAALLALVFQRWAGIKTAVNGAKAGATIGALIGLAIDTGFYSMTNLYTGGLVPMVVDVVAMAVLMAIGGAVVGLVLGMGGDN